MGTPSTFRTGKIRYSAQVFLLFRLDITVLIQQNGEIICCNDKSIKRKPSAYIQSDYVKKSCYLLYYEHLEVTNPYIDDQQKKGDQEAMFLRTIRQLDDNVFVAAHFNISLVAEDIHTLYARGWLNDKVVMAYLRMTRVLCPWVSVIDTFLVTSLLAGRMAQAKTFLTTEHLKSDKVLIPVNTDSHWFLIVIDVAQKTILTMDSRTGHNRNAILVRDFLESNDGMQNGWSVQVDKKCFKQTNGDDCGVFACQNAVDKALGRNPTCSPERVSAMRMAMVFEVLTGTLMPRN